MASSTGPILAAGGLVWANNVLVGKQPEDFFTATARIGIGTGVAVGFLALIEKAAPDLALAFAYASLVTVLLVRIPPKSNNPTPMENALKFLGL